MHPVRELGEQMMRAADGLRRLSEFGDQHGINVLVENHGGFLQRHVVMG